MTAIQMRREMFAEDNVDVFLSDETPGLIDIYNNHELDVVFSHVYCYSVAVCVGIKRHAGLLFPQLMLRKLIPNNESWDYTDVFFWNPNAMLYFLYMHLHKRDDFKLHLYTDGMAQYIQPGLSEKNINASIPFYNNVEKRLWQLLYGKLGIKNSILDYYMYAPEHTVLDQGLPLVGIPPIQKHNAELVDLYNKVFEYDSSKIISEKIILIDQLPIRMHYVEEHEKMLDVLQENFADDTIVKPHPRLEKDYYEKWNLKILRDNFSFDLYCLNNDLSDKIFITHSSGAVFFPYILFDENPTVIAIAGLCKKEKTVKRVMNVLCPALIRAGKNLYYPADMDEFSKNLVECYENL